MFVFGEVQDPLDETSQLVEEIVKNQLITLIIEAVSQAHKRGSKTLQAEDLIFLIRHDRSKVNRLKTFLSWKDVRKNAREKGGDTALDEDLMDDDVNKTNVKIKKMNINFSWDPFTMYNGILEDDDDDDADEDERQAYEDQINRLRIADKITRSMTKEEYIYYAECRQASFIYKKLKRFRDWCDMSKYYESKASSDIIDSLGFLCHEAVSAITETALEIKRQEDIRKAISPESNATSGELFYGLFQKPPGDATPLLPRHIQEAYRILQNNPNPLNNFRNRNTRSGIKLI
ncbi:transcription initiation factor IID, 18kD subunit-domain-containing protein [Globomyces pollinis-pini]|nr:transcription initiation factor IID, 18kD subunit-domain-containing protein [Globomyces pollinis-pini]